MTERSNMQLSCPRCGADMSVEVWTSVNASDDPDAAQWLIDGFLFEHECECVGFLFFNAAFLLPTATGQCQQRGENHWDKKLLHDCCLYCLFGRSIQLSISIPGIRSKWSMFSVTIT